jgi:signal peptidase I
MYPTLEPNNYLIINKIPYTLGEPSRGDIVVFKSHLLTEDGKEKDLIKRVIAVPGDHLLIESGRVYVNDVEIDESYINGTGKYGGNPVDTSGTSWAYKDGYTANTFWKTPNNQINMPVGVTSSYAPGYVGGGNWYTGSSNINLESTQQHTMNSGHDINIDVTPAVNMHYSASIENNGFILKLTDDLEFNTVSAIRLKYYGADTNTIYPPSLELKWDDSVFAPGDLTSLNTSQAVIDISNNKGKYVNEGKQRFRIHARPQHPVRTFTTGSAYKTNYALPVASHYGIKDEFTEEMVTPFDTSFTKISCDANGPYFDVYMDGLQPERYYRVLVKTELDGSTVVVDTDNTFKVVRNG